MKQCRYKVHTSTCRFLYLPALSRPNFVLAWKVEQTNNTIKHKQWTHYLVCIVIATRSFSFVLPIASNISHQRIYGINICLTLFLIWIDETITVTIQPLEIYYVSGMSLNYICILDSSKPKVKKLAKHVPLAHTLRVRMHIEW